MDEDESDARNSQGYRIHMWMDVDGLFVFIECRQSKEKEKREIKPSLDHRPPLYIWTVINCWEIKPHKMYSIKHELKCLVNHNIKIYF